MSAKDFRTWHGTVIAAVVLAEANERARTVAARKRAVAAAMREVSEYLGNTPAVARKSYVDPRVVDLFNDGVTISPDLASTDDDLVRRHHPRQDRARRAEPAAELRPGEHHFDEAADRLRKQPRGPQSVGSFVRQGALRHR